MLLLAGSAIKRGRQADRQREEEGNSGKYSRVTCRKDKIKTCGGREKRGPGVIHINAGIFHTLTFGYDYVSVLSVSSLACSERKRP